MSCPWTVSQVSIVQDTPSPQVEASTQLTSHCPATQVCPAPQLMGVCSQAPVPLLHVSTVQGSGSEQSLGGKLHVLVPWLQRFVVHGLLSSQSMFSTHPPEQIPLTQASPLGQLIGVFWHSPVCVSQVSIVHRSVSTQSPCSVQPVNSGP